MIFFIVDKGLTIETGGYRRSYNAHRDLDAKQFASDDVYCTSLGEYERLLGKLKEAGAKSRLLPEDSVRANPYFPRELGVSNRNEQQRVQGKQQGPQPTVKLREQIAVLPKKRLRIAIINGFGTGMGDSLVGLSAFRHVYPLLAEHCEELHIDAYIRADGIARLDLLYRQYPMLRRVRLMPLSLAEFCAYDAFFDCSAVIYRYDAHGPVPMLDYYLHLLGLEPAQIPSAEKRNLLPLQQTVYEDLQAHLLSLRARGPLLLFHPQTSTETRSIPPATQRRLLDYLLEQTDYEIIALTPIAYPEHAKVHDLSRLSSSFLHLSALVAQMDALISADTVVYHIADAFHIPGVVLFSTIDPALRLPYYPTLRGILLKGARENPYFGRHRQARNLPLDDLLALWDGLEPAQVLAELQAAIQAAAQQSPPAAAYARLAESLLKQNRGEAALRFYQQGALLDPENAAYWLRIGDLERSRRHWDAALAAYHEVLLLEPNHISALGYSGLVYKAQGQFDEALKIQRRVLELEPHNLSAQGNIANLLREQKHYAEAEAGFLAILAQAPNHAEAHLNLGLTYFAQNRYDEAIACYQRVLECEPDSAQARNNLGCAYHALNQEKQALACFEQALEQQADYHEARWNLGLAQLRYGDYPNGFAHYESRIEKTLQDYPHPEGKPRWDGSPLNGRILLVYWEQGYGDSIQYLRFFQALRGGTVIFSCRPELADLFRDFPGIDALIPAREDARIPRREFDVWLPLMSLPHVLGFDPRQQPAPTPYLFADPGKLAAWQQRLPQDKLNIGLVWAGNPLHYNSHNRDCPAHYFNELQAVDGVRFYSLMMREEDKPNLPLESLGADLHHFTDTAAALCALDLLICVDTAVAHLAGALGRPVWLLLPFAPDWRWLLGRDDAPWYADFRLFRQARPGAWGDVLVEVKQALRQACAQRDAAKQQLAQIEALLEQGNAVRKQEQDPQQALALYRQAQALDPRYAQTWHLQGFTHYEQRDWAEAEAAVRTMLRCSPNSPSGLNLLGLIHLDQDRLREAGWLFRQGLRVAPRNVELLNNYGALLEQLNRVEESLACYRAALENAPQHLKINYNIALALLKLGRYQEAWKPHELRFHALGERAAIPLDLDEKRWDGAPLQGRRLLVHFEQGYGDVLQFMRFLPALRRFGGQVILVIPDGLSSLLGKDIPGADEVYGGSIRKQPDIAYDVWTPLMSLPYWLNLDLADLPATYFPYLFPAADKLAQWRERLGDADGALRVGLVWAGNPRHGNDQRRSARLAQFAPLAQLSGIHFYSLQKGQAARQKPPQGLELEHLGKELEDFGDTAAVLSLLDLVISVDTAVIHLAGALHRPAWLLLPFAPDCRWLLEREDSPWYPSLQLLRQTAPNDWDGLLARVAETLRAYQQQRRQQRAAAAQIDELLNTAATQPGIALQTLERAVALDPQHALARFRLAYYHYHQHRYAEALKQVQASLGADSSYTPALNLAGILLAARGDWEAAAHYYRQGLRCAPQDAGLWNNLGVLEEDRNRLEQAEQAYRRACECAPHTANYAYNLSLCRLKQGRFREAWGGYEQRLPVLGPRSKVAALPLDKRWDGSPLNGRRLLLHFEQGFGDTIQFLRFVPFIRKYDGKVLLAAPLGLLSLLEEFPGIDALIAVKPDQPTPEVDYDVWLPLLSLPRVLRISDEQLLHIQTPYLIAPTQALETWGKRFPKGNELRVGLVWAGNPQHRHDSRRSCPPQALQALASVSGVRYFSLQVDPTQSLEKLPDDFPLTPLAAEIDDFSATAALLCHLDLVICVDTAVAHLAGALGRPAWVLLPYSPDWRWQLAREDSPWYPSLRLFRQAQPEAWDQVLAQVVTALRERVARYRTPPALPADTVALLRQGEAQQQRGQLGNALALYQRAMRLHPDSPEVAFLIGNLHLRRRAWDEVIQAYRRTLHYRPRHEAAWSNLGGVYQMNRQLALALSCNNETLRLSPNLPLNWSNRGLILSGLGYRHQALACLRRALFLDRNYLPAYPHLGRLLRQLGRLQDAAQCFEDALRLKSDDAAMHYEAGLTYCNGNNFKLARRHLRAALQLQRDDLRSLRLLATCYEQLGEQEEAALCHARVLKLQPDDPETLEKIALRQQRDGDYQAALDSYRRALAHAPQTMQARLQHKQAFLHLLLGHFAEGWAAYEARLLENNRMPDFLLRWRWDGRELPGQTLLVHWEQGHGDTLHFIRYLPLVKARVGRVVLACQAALQPLLAGCPGADEVIASDGEHWPDDYKYWTLTASLPHLLGVAEPLEEAPYLHADAEKIRIWQQRLAAQDGLKIGLAWAGSPTNRRDAERSCDLQQFASLAAHSGVHFYSLQKGAAAEQAAPPGLNLQGCERDLEDFSDTAALISCLDLVICVDTAVAHLAGALGRPAWVLLSARPDWRWQLQRDDSLWYPSLRLFRQPQPGDWDSVFSAVAAALPEFMEQAEKKLHLPAASVTALEAGNAAMLAEDWAAAEQAYQQVLSLAPDCGEVHFRLGNLALQQKNDAKAKQAYLEAVRCQPLHEGAWNNLGGLYQRDKDYPQCLRCNAGVLSVAPLSAVAWSNRGYVLQKIGKLEAAYYCGHHALELDPDYPTAWNNFGKTCKEMNRLEEAMSCFRRALELTPESSEPHKSLADILELQNQPEAAADCYREVLKQEQGNALVHLNLGITLLKRGQFEEGWEEYEWRFLTDPERYAQLSKPRWQGEPLQGRRLLVHWEQGLGDSLQFMRYLPMIGGGEVIFATQQPLLKVAQSLKGVNQLIVGNKCDPEGIDYDVWISLLSLPRLFQTRVDTIPAELAYISAPKSKVTQWRKRLQEPGLRIGIVWAGNPQHNNDRNRSCPPELFTALAELPGVQCYSLQKGKVASAPENWPVIDLAPQLDDFEDTAAALCALDMLISVDTSVAHLAAALQCPTWLLLPFAPDWRWLLEGEETPWYPGMRLFRQERVGDWDGVFARVQEALTEKLKLPQDI